MEATGTYAKAKVERLPSEKFFSIEFPGYVKNFEKAKEMLGGDIAITNAYLGGAPLDLRYRPKDPYSLPIQGESVATGNMLLKATRRFKVRRRPGAGRSLPPYREPNEDDIPLEGDEPKVTFQVLGMIPLTARFSGLADYQHIVDPKDEFVKIKSDLLNLEYEDLVALKIDNRNPVEDFSTLQLLPPPQISKSTLPLLYRYKGRVVADVQDEGAAKKRGPKKGASQRILPQVSSAEGPIHIGSGESDDDSQNE